MYFVELGRPRGENLEPIEGNEAQASHRSARNRWVAFLFMLVLLWPGVAGAQAQEVREFQGGKLYRAGPFKVLVLRGNWETMGRQYGALAGEAMKGMHREIVRQYGECIAPSQRESLEAFSARLFALYPERFQKLARGMAQTSQLRVQEVAVLSEFFDYYLYASASQQKQCSCLSAWGSWTPDGTLVLGRNFDFPKFFRKFDPYLMVTVYNPDDGSHSVAVITYPGQIGAIQAFNDAGLVLENNNGATCGDETRCFGEFIPFLAQDLSMLLDHGDLPSLEAAMQTIRLHHPLVYNVADAHRARCYEFTTSRTLGRGEASDGFLVGVNHFLAPGWPTSPPSAPLEDSRLRHNNLVSQVRKHQGQLDYQVMRDILDLSVEAGGATPKEHSIYQFVYVPARLHLDLKAAEYADWTHLDLIDFFR